MPSLHFAGRPMVFRIFLRLPLRIAVAMAVILLTWLAMPGLAHAQAGPTTVTRRYVYDAYQQLCKVIEPETGATVMNYDAAGNLAWSAAGLALANATQCTHNEAWASPRVVLRQYDNRNRVTTLSFPDGNGNQTWSYTPDGLPRQIVTDAGTTSVTNAYTYNKRRMLTGESSSQPGWYSWGIGYGYDANGSLATQTYPTGLAVDFAPNALGQPTRAGTMANGVSYYPNGAIRQFTYGNGVVHTMQQNARQLPARSTDGGVFDFTFRYDPNGNTTNIDDVNQPPSQYTGSRDMAYDKLDRLTYAHLHWWQVNNFRYDALDNIRRKDHFNGSTTTVQNYEYDGKNRLSLLRNEGGAATTAFEFDDQGNLEVKNGQTYEFDFGNRLRNVAGKEYYSYDGHGRRVVAWRPAGVAGPNATLTVSQYSQAGQLTYHENSNKTLATENIYLAGSLVASRERNWSTNVMATRYQHTDALGSPVATTNEAGQVVERTNYEPYGAAINKAVDGVGYTGHVMDAATGLTYMQQRYYDPTLGRFLSVDPVTADGNTGGNFNRYWYGNNNPYKFIDPDGRETVFVVNQNGFGHVGYWTSRGGGNGQPSLYDPNGSFIKDEIGVATGAGANIQKFVQFQLSDGPKVSVYRMDTTLEEEVALANSAEDTGTWRTMDCALSSTQAARLSSDRFSDLEQAFTPGGAKKSLDNFMTSQSKKEGGLNIERSGFDGFKGVFRVEGRIDSQRLEKEQDK